MEPERWRKVADIFEAALERGPEARQEFLESACGGDHELRLQVDRLVAKGEEAGRFLETPAMRVSMATPGSTGALVGRQFGPYRIVSTIGAGGMGEVYRAHDSKLGRDIAIKTLPPEFAGSAERLTLFRREARTLAALNHPHIAAIYGLEESDGVDCLILELVEGEILHGPLPIATALDRAHQVAEALEAAHAKGIIHRDLKPANVKVTPDGAVKVLDFGLAKAIRGSGQDRDLWEAATVTGVSTLVGNVVGTPGYMSPEQARGEEVDKRTDIWAFGCLVYELLAGKRAFPGETYSDTIAAMLEGEPDWQALPAKTPPRIRRLLRRCLQKNPDRRLADIADARRTIEEVQRGSKRRQGIAAAGVALLGIGVAVWMRGPDRFTDAKTTSASFGRPGGARSVKAESHELYLRGRYVWEKRTEEGYRQAIEYFEKAAKADPESGEAYSGLADCYISLPQLRVVSPKIGMPKAESFARKAIALDDSLAEAHASLAEVKELYDWDWAGAEKEYKRAIELRPRWATAHHWYAMYLNAVGRKNDALEEIEKARLIDPVSLISDTNRGWILWCNRQNGQAVDQLRRTIELEPAFVNAHYKLGLVYETEGDYADAVSEFSKQERLAGEDPDSWDRFESAFRRGGWRGYCEERLASLQRLTKRQYVSPASFALAYLRLGDKERTFQWLEAAFDEHSEVLAYLRVDPRFDALRDDRRFDQLLSRVGLASPR